MDTAHRRLTTHIRALARKKRWSGNQVADFAGMSRGYLSEVLSGRKSPSLRTLVKIEGALEVEVRDLLAWFLRPRASPKGSGRPLDARIRLAPRSSPASLPV